MKNKGITLIALIITIIVLLILAAISILTLTGENGILTQADKAREKNGIESLKESVGLVLSGRRIAKENGKEMSKLDEDLKTIEGAEVEKVKEVKVDACYVTKDGYTVTVYEEGDIEEGKVQIWDGTSIEVPEFKEFNWYIYNGAQMKFFEEFVNNGNSLTEAQRTLVQEKGYNENDIKIETETIVYLMENIDLGARQKDGELTTGTAWTEIGIDTTNSFNGIFEGNNHFIRGVYMQREGQSFVGLFGFVRNTVKSLTIKDSYIEGLKYVGGIAGACGTMKNCHNKNTTVTIKETNGKYVGGITGDSKDMEHCTNSGRVICNGNCCGGIVGNPEGNAIINNCINTGKIESGGQYVGGICGYAKSGCTIGNCINTGAVKQEFASSYTGYRQDVGGIVPLITGGDIVHHCYNTGNILGSGNYVGGIVGRALGDDNTINYCYNSGDVSGKNRIGGILGFFGGSNGNSMTILTKCYNKGKIIGTNNIGSILGFNDSTLDITNSYYLSSIGIGAINGADDESKKVMSTTEDIKSYEEFINWIENK